MGRVDDIYIYSVAGRNSLSPQLKKKKKIEAIEFRRREEKFIGESALATSDAEFPGVLGRKKREGAIEAPPKQPMYTERMLRVVPSASVCSSIQAMTSSSTFFLILSHLQTRNQTHSRLYHCELSSFKL